MGNEVILEPGDVMTVGELSFGIRTPMTYRNGEFYPRNGCLSTGYIPTDPGWYTPPKTKATSEIICHCKKCDSRMYMTKLVNHSDGYKKVYLTCPEKALWRPNHDVAVYQSFDGESFSRMK